MLRSTDRPLTAEQSKRLHESLKADDAKAFIERMRKAIDDERDRKYYEAGLLIARCKRAIYLRTHGPGARA